MGEFLEVDLPQEAMVVSQASLVLQLRIVVTQPVAGCVYAIQRGRADVEQVQTGAAADLMFDVTIELRRTDGGLDPRGPHVQGPRGGRFLYINSGTLAGQSDSCWTRRAKVSLRGLGDLVLSEIPPAIGAEARIAGRARDLGPACASVPLLNGCWRLVRS